MYKSDALTLIPTKSKELALNIPHRNVYALSLDKNGNYNAHWKFQESEDQRSSVMLGMSPTNYHNFLVCNNVEWHPRFTFNLPKIGRAKRRCIRAGAVLKIKGLSTQELNHFESYLKNLKQYRSPNCHIGALQALKAGLGVQIPGLDHWRLGPEDFLRLILEKGFIKDGKKVDVELIISKNISPVEMIKEVQFFQNKFKWMYMLNDFLYFFIKRIFRKQVICE